ncbi:NUDIX domain-containing protein [Domibacillus enclensis]|uniref:ADP-ribose pyrophosphatase n=1 Tax=Domibacillus enclensis TaxID=1017273 RepID=A0A1N7BPP0_9BACI|nr:NUDIX domain-containing protein [Domibacillus enclensis]OXS74501.1 ADP-ribose pyrophosphatase [Domibacillus enclensis]SIR53295.1 ADP-ribose pyrophosphatase YjhB, NUDIX family [Domibacillus enclensis]
MKKYDSSKYRTPDGYTADIAVFTILSEKKEEKAPPDMKLCMMLIERAAKDSEGNQNIEAEKWAIPGGFIQPDETGIEAAARELAEETGVSGLHIRHFGTYDTPGRDPRGWIISNAFYAIVPESALEKRMASDDAADVQLFTVADVLNLDLAFDHRQIIRDALNVIQSEMLTTKMAQNFLPDEFTLSELQRVLLTVTDDAKIASDPVFFARAPKLPFIELAVDEAGVPKKTTRHSYRPSRLYRFNEIEVIESIYG